MPIRRLKPLELGRKEASLDDVLKRLDAILNVLTRLQLANDKILTQRDKVRIMHKIGLRNQEIARTLGISSLQVATVINQLRKAESRE